MTKILKYVRNLNRWRASIKFAPRSYYEVGYFATCEEAERKLDFEFRWFGGEEGKDLEDVGSTAHMSEFDRLNSYL